MNDTVSSSCTNRDSRHRWSLQTTSRLQQPIHRAAGAGDVPLADAFRDESLPRRAEGIGEEGEEQPRLEGDVVRCDGGRAAFFSAVCRRLCGAAAARGDCFTNAHISPLSSLQWNGHEEPT